MRSPKDVVSEYIAAAGLSPSEFARLVGLDASTISKILSGARPVGELAALKIEQATRDAYVRRVVKIEPLERDALRPRSRKVAA